MYDIGRRVLHVLRKRLCIAKGKSKDWRKRSQTSEENDFFDQTETKVDSREEPSQVYEKHDTRGNAFGTEDSRTFADRKTISYTIRLIMSDVGQWSSDDGWRRDPSTK